MKYDALAAGGVEIGERVPIPDWLVPPTTPASRWRRRRRPAISRPKARRARTQLQQRRRPRPREILTRDGRRRRADPRPAERGRRARAGARDARRSRSTGEVEGWTVDLDRLGDAADLTAAVTRERYPDLAIPFHARGRHFVAGAPQPAGRRPGGARPRRLRPRHPLGAARRRRRPGLALSRPGQRRDLRPLRRPRGRQPAHVRGRRRSTISAGARRRETLARRLPGSARTIRCSASTAAPPCSAGSARRCWRGPTCSRTGAPAASTTCSPRAPTAAACPRRRSSSCCSRRSARSGRTGWSIDGVPLGDCWRHPAIRRDDASDGLVPLHKLSQWLSYSLIEPLEEAGIAVIDVDGLTGLAEYRNGGLFVDTGVLALADPADAGAAAPGLRSADRRLAGDDRRPARPAGAAGARAARRRRGGLSRWPACSRAAPGPPAAASPPSAAPAAARPSPSSATERYSRDSTWTD